MTNYQEAVDAANRWRRTQGDDRYLTAGIVRIFDGRVYGWSTELGAAGTERPGALAVSAHGSVWEAVGGNAQNGAREWSEIERLTGDGGPQFAAASGRDITPQLREKLGDKPMAMGTFFRGARSVLGLPDEPELHDEPGEPKSRGPGT